MAYASCQTVSHCQTGQIVPIIGYVGSSNLTMAGLEKQGELNVDVLDEQEVAIKLSK